MDGYIGQILAVGMTWAPRNWAICDGSLIAISSNTALFSLIGTLYGGDGRTTFALPDLRGRIPVGQGNGPGLSAYRVGQKGGVEMVTLNTLEMPNHNHTAAVSGTVTVGVNSSNANQEDSDGHVLGQTNGNLVYNNAAPANGEALGGVSHNLSATIGNNGGNQAHENRQPFLVVSWCICLQGIYPSRS